MSPDEIGAMRWFVKLARQAPGDWSNMGGSEPGQEGDEAYRYQLAFMTYFLALEQYHKTPAYRGVPTEAMDAFIQKMIRKDVWYYWAEVSKGSKRLDPVLTAYGPGWIDPVREKNIMYSGHLMQMVGLYEMLTRDFKYDRQGSLVFLWDVAGDIRGRWEYNHRSLVEIAYRQIVDNPWHAVECEINMIFPECNQHPMLAIMLHDALHGTHWSGPAAEALGQTFRDKALINPETHRTSFAYQVHQDRTIPAAGVDADGWTGVMMHAWDRESVERNYPFQRDAGLERLSDGTAHASSRAFGGANLGEGFFAMLAKEVGDTATAEAILRWADGNLNPIREGGYLYYPRDDGKQIWHLSGILLACARANVKDGFWALHNRAWSEEHFTNPYLSNVPYPQAAVSRAAWDAGEQALVATLVPGEKGGTPIEFSIHQLDPAAQYVVTKNGIQVAVVRRGSVQQSDEQTKAALVSWTGSGVRIATTLVHPETFLVAVTEDREGQQ